METLTREQAAEIIKCSNDFSYFCSQYVLISSWMVPESIENRTIPFELHECQKELFDFLEETMWGIFSKYRWGGFTTLCVIYNLWCCLFKTDQSILHVWKTDREACHHSETVNLCLRHLPDWMTGETGPHNDHKKQFPLTGGILYFLTPTSALGKDFTTLYLDEAAYIPNMERNFKSWWPMISTGRKVFVFSTPNTDKDWFWQFLTKVRSGERNDFKELKTSVYDHPVISVPERLAKYREHLTEIGYKKELEQIPPVYEDNKNGEKSS